MAVFNGAFPILPGKEDTAREFAADINGTRRDDFNSMQASARTTRETWTLQETPMGAFMLVWFEAPDIDAAFVELATASDEASVWFRGRVLELTGVDLAEPAGAAPELLVDWNA